MEEATPDHTCCNCFSSPFKKRAKSTDQPDESPNDEFFYRKFSDSLGISNIDLSPVPQRSKKNSDCSIGNINDGKGPKIGEPSCQQQKRSNLSVPGSLKPEVNGRSLESLYRRTSKGTEDKAMLLAEDAEVGTDSPQLRASSPGKIKHDPRRDGMVFDDSPPDASVPLEDGALSPYNNGVPKISPVSPSGRESATWDSFSDIPFVDEGSLHYSEGASSACSTDTSRLLWHMAENGLLDEDSLLGESQDRQRSFDSVFAELMYTRRKTESLVTDITSEDTSEMRRMYSDSDPGENVRRSCGEMDEEICCAIEEDTALEEPLISSASSSEADDDADDSSDSLTLSETEHEKKCEVERLGKQIRQVYPESRHRLPRSLSSNCDDGQHLLPPLYHTTYTSDPLLLAFSSSRSQDSL